MLSTTYSIHDVKIKLEEEYTAYSLSSEIAMDKVIESSFDDVKLLNIYPVIGSTEYAVLAAKDKVGLEEREEYLYWAEVYYVCVAFLERRISKLATTTSAKSKEKLEVEGYNYEFSTEAGAGAISEMGLAVKEFYDKAVHFMCLIGYNPHDLQRSGNYYGGGTVDLSDNGGVV